MERNGGRMTSFEQYDSKEEAYKAGYQNGKLIGTLETIKKVIEKLREEDSDGD